MATRKAQPRGDMPVVRLTVEDVVKSGNSLLNKKQLNQLLGPTPENARYEKAAKGGGVWVYVKGVYVRKVLNMVFGFDWNFEILSDQVMGSFQDRNEQVICRGRLSCNVRNKDGDLVTVIKKDQYGRCDVKYMKKGGYLDIGNDFKGAATDCLKKCASTLGVASDVYDEEDFKWIQLINEATDNLLFLGQNFTTRDQMLESITFHLSKEINEVNDLSTLLGLHPHFRKDPEVLALFEEKRAEIERNEVS